MRKTLQEKLSRDFKGVLREICLYGTPNTKFLDRSTMTVGAVTRKLKKDIESLKMSANYHGAFSLSANQVGFDHSFFIMAKHLKDGVWLNRRLEKEIKYETVINPKIKKVARLEEYGWEYCASFPNVRASVKRFDRILVSYMDEEMEEVEKELSGFEARVFQHELDHLKGGHILNWDISGGDVELIAGASEDFPHFEKALSEYKDTLSRMKEDHPEMFEKQKQLTDLNMVADENNPDYWDRSIKPNKNFAFSREEEFNQKLEEAIQQDFEMHFVI